MNVIDSMSKTIEELEERNKILEKENKEWKESYNKLAEFTGERFNRSNKEIAKLKGFNNELMETIDDCDGDCQWVEEDD